MPLPVAAAAAAPAVAPAAGASMGAVLGAAGITAGASLLGGLAANRQRQKEVEEAKRLKEEEMRRKQLSELFKMKQDTGAEYAKQQHNAFAQLMEGYSRALV
jgi:hypothetical protein